MLDFIHKHIPNLFTKNLIFRFSDKQMGLLLVAEKRVR
jgi:hypothetical protein